MALCGFCGKPVAARFVALADGSLCHAFCWEAWLPIGGERLTNRDWRLAELNGVDAQRARENPRPSY